MSRLLALALAFGAFGLSFNPAYADPSDDLALEKKLSAEYLERMAAEPGAQALEQGVVYRPIFENPSGVRPELSSVLKVTYHLSDREGKLIEESLSSDEIAEFPLSKLIACWKIALPKMSVGSLAKVSCPSDAAYGDKGVAGVIKPGAALTFRVVLHEVK